MLKHPLLPRVLLPLALLSLAGWWWFASKTPAGAPAVAQVAAPASPAAAPKASASPAPSSPAASAATAPAGNSGTTIAPSAPAQFSYAQGWNQPQPDAFAAFRAWTERYLAASSAVRAALEAEGLTLAQQRRVAMKQLIERDPRLALDLTVPAAVRTSLPTTIVAELEQRFSAIGDFSLMAIDYDLKERIRRQQAGLNSDPFQSFIQWAGGPEYRAYVYGRRAEMTTKFGVPLHGVALDGVAALHEAAARLLEPGETIPAGAAIATVAPATPASTAAVAEVGGKFYRFATLEDLAAAERKLEAAEAKVGPREIPPADTILLAAPATTGVPPSPPLENAASTWTTGNKKILVIRVDFSDLTGDPKGLDNATYTQAYVQGIADNQIAPYYIKSSYGLTTLTTTVTSQLYRMPQTAAYYAVSNLNTQLHTDARALAAAGYTIANYDRVLVLFSHLGRITGSQITYGGLANVTGPYSWINGEFDFRVVAHELGHTYGLFHANLWTVTDGNPLSASGTSTEYGDDFDTMGANFANDQRTDFNPWFKNLLGWVADSQVQTITTSGTYRINRFDNATGTGSLGLKIGRNSTTNYWVGARRGFTTNTSMQHGAYVIWGYTTNKQSNVLDLVTPGTSVTDAALPLGSTLLDTVGNISIKALAEGGTAPNEYLDVEINVGLNGLPVITAHPVSQGFTVGTSVSLSVTATGTAPLRYQWSKNGTSIPLATNATYLLSSPQASDTGTYVVQVTNTVGTAVSNSATLSVNATPFIASQPGNLAGPAGFTATFRVGVTGFPTSTYQWRKGGTNISGATAATYTISNAQSANVGSYDVVVTNTLGTVTSSAATLSVFTASAPPSNDNFASAWTLAGNLGQASDTNVGATGETGEPSHYTSGGTSHGNDSSVWFRWTPGVSGIAQVDTIGSSIDSVLAVYTGTTLTTLTSIAQNDDGATTTGGVSLVTFPITAGTAYSIAVGSYDSGDGGSITLNYKAVGSPAIGAQPVNAVAALGGSTSFSVVATGTELAYQWYRNGTAIAGATSATLSLSNLQPADVGSYYVIVSNSAGSVTSNTVTLSGTNSPPTIATQPVNITVVSGQTASFTVSATGTSLAYQWRRNGISIPGATSATYSLGTVTRSDADYYDVSVFSGLTPTVSQTARLSVAPTAYPTLVVPDPAWDIRPEVPNNGPGYVMAALSDGRLYVAGSLTGIDATRRTGIARVKADGTPDTTFNPPEIDDTVRAIIVQPDGKVLIGGLFVRVGGVVCNRIARLNVDGSLDPTFNAGTAASGAVLCLARQSDGKIVVGGSFASFAGTVRRFLVRLNSDGTLDPGFQAGGMNSTVNAVAVQANDSILVAGAFTGYNSISGNVLSASVPRNRLARLNFAGALDTTFDPSANSTVNSMALQADGKIVVTGLFTQVGTSTVGFIARLGTDGVVDPAFNNASAGGLSASASTLAVQADGKILAGGFFSTYGGAAAGNLVRINSDGSRDTGFLCASLNGTVNGLAIAPDGKSLVAGVFSSHVSTAAVSTPLLRFARLNTDGSPDTTLTLSPRGPGYINAVVPLPDGKTLVAGYFTSLRGTTVPTGVARINADGTVDASFNAGGVGANSNVYTTLALPDGKIYIGGAFTTYGGSTVNRIARLKADGTIDPDFNTRGGVNNSVYTLARLPGGRLLVAGGFTTVGTGALTRNRLVVYNSDGSVDSTFDSGTGASSTIYASAVQADGKVLIGGSFTTYNGVTATRAARLTVTGAVDSSFNTSLNSEVIALAVQPDGYILLGGFFTQVNSSFNRNGIVRVRGTDSVVDAGFVPPTVGGPVYSLLMQEDGKVLIRGSFASLDGAPGSMFLGRLNSNGMLDPTFGSGGFPTTSFHPSVMAMRDNGQLVTHAAGASPFIGSQPGSLPTITTQPQGQAVAVGSSPTLSVVASGPNALPLTYQWAYNGTPISKATANTFSITNFSSGQVGNYSVTVTNELGSTLSAIAPMVLTATAVAITAQPLPQTVAPGGTATFTVSATGDPAPSYQWQHRPSGSTSFVNLITGGAYAGATSATLTVSSVTAAMQGDQFQCVVSNGIGLAATSDSVALAVEQPPVFTSASATTFYAKEDNTFTVTASGIPAPTFTITNNNPPAWLSINETTGLLSGTPPSTYDSPLLVIIEARNGRPPNAQQLLNLILLPSPGVPVITVPPAPQVISLGATLTLSVTATGTPAPTYQWFWYHNEIIGATSATFVRPNAQLSDAGIYYVVVSNRVGSTQSIPINVYVVPPGTSAQQAVLRGGYEVGKTVTIVNTVNHSGSITGAGWYTVLPAGWTFNSSSGDSGATKKPLPGTTGLVEWSWSTPPASPLTFTYVLNVPADAAGIQSLVSYAKVVQSDSTIPFVARPDPLLVSVAPVRHSADSDADGKINLFELTRVIELYNVRRDTIRTGAYKVEPLSEDGFASEPTRTAPATLSTWHSADTNHDSYISLLELTRVIELYNTRSGTERTGAYHLQAGTEDGFAVGP